MIGQQKLVLLWAGMVLMAALCPGVQSKGGRGGGGRGSGSGPRSQGKGGSSKQGLKIAGAAVAGVVGGAAIGYGLGSLGKSRHSGGGYGKDGFYSTESQRFNNKSAWPRFRNAAAPCPASTFLLTVAPALPFLVGAWVRGF